MNTGNSPPKRRQGLDVVWLAGGLLVTVLAASVLRTLPAVSPTTVALSFLLPVLASATAARLWVSVVLSIVAMLTLNFFFLPPIGTFHIADVQNWVALFVFLAVAVSASQLSAAAQARAAEAAARASQLEAERANTEMARRRASLAAALLASIGHDVRTPLTAARIAVTNVQDSRSSEERRQHAAIAHAELNRLSGIVEDVLDMARIEANAILVDRQFVTAADVVDAAVAHVGRSLDAHQFRVDATDTWTVSIDPRLTSRAVSYLLDNATRYAPPGTEVTVRARVDDNGLRVTVSDRGPGLLPAEIEEAFAPLFRGSAAGGHPGTGMGLAIARGLLEAQHGTLRAANRPDGGATFEIIVPGPNKPVGEA
jgi:two-component system, OmpR family, sensor histidine kinase KdpD